MNEQELRRVLVRVVPELPSPEDRVGAVVNRARRRQRVVVTAAAAVLTGVVALGSVPVLRAFAGRPENGFTSGGTPSASPTQRADGVLETPGCVGYNPSLATSVDGTPVAPNQEALAELAQRVMPYALSHFGDVWADAEMRPDGRLRLNRKPSRQFDAWVMREFATECLEIANARASAREMEAWSRRISDDFRYWHNRGIEIFTVGGSPVDGVLVVEVAEADVAKARSEIPKRYPDLRIRVEKGTPVHLDGG